MKILFRIIISVFLLLVFGAFGTVAYVKTSGGSRWVVSKIQDILARHFDTELKFDDAQLNIFEEIRIVNLTIHSGYQGNQLDVRVPLIDIKYQIEFLKRKISVTEAVLDRPRIDFRKIKSAISPNAKSETDNAGSIGNRIRHPPIELEFENINVKNLELHFVSDDGVVADVHDLDLETKILLLKNQFGMSLALAAERPNHLSLFGNMNGDWTTNSKFDVEITYDGAHWIYDFKLVHAVAALTNFQMREPTLIEIQDLSLTSDSQIKLRSKDFMSFDSAVAQVAHCKALMILKKLNVIHGVDHLKISQVELNLQSELKDRIELQLETRINTLDDPLRFSKPILADLNSHLSASQDLKHFKTTFKAEGAGAQFLSAAAKIDRENTGDPWAFSGDLKLNIGRNMMESVRALGNLKKSAPFEISSQFDGHALVDFDFNFKSEIEKLKLPISKDDFSMTLSSRVSSSASRRHFDFVSSIAISNSEFGSWEFKNSSKYFLTEDMVKHFSGETEMTETKASTQLPLELLKPLSLTHKIEIDAEAMTGAIKVHSPLLKVAKLGTLHDTDLDAKVSMDHLTTDKNFAFDVKLNQGPVDLQNQVKGAEVSLDRLRINIVGQIKRQIFLNVEKFEVLMNDGLVGLRGDASGNLKTQDAQARLTANFAFGKNFPEIMGQRISGELNAPIDISLHEGRDLNVDGAVDFKRFGVSKKEYGIEELNGRISISEHFVKSQKGIQFTDLITQNAFERVNFERLRPLLQTSDQISIQKIRWQEKNYGPLRGYISMKQNMILLHEFRLDLDEGGIYGEMFFDAYPKNLQFGLLSRMTAINLTQVLPNQFLKKIPPGDQKVSARTGFVFSINKSILNGRVDITEIGSGQLLTMINVLDPQFQDEKLNKVRRVLEIGYPSSVAMNFNQGYLDLDMDLIALGISQHESIRSIPLSGFLSQSTSEIISASQKGPLK